MYIFRHYAIAYCILNRLQYNIDITFMCTGRQKFVWFTLLQNSLLLQWCGTKLTVSLRYACIYILGSDRICLAIQEINKTKSLPLGVIITWDILKSKLQKAICDVNI